MSAADYRDEIELPETVDAELESCRRLVRNPKADKAAMFEIGATAVFRVVDKDDAQIRQAAVDTLYDIAVGADIADDPAQAILDRAYAKSFELPPEHDPIQQTWETNDPRKKGQANGYYAAPIPSPDDYGATNALPATIDDASLIIPAALITPASWPSEAPPSVEWVAAGRIPRGDVTTEHGDGGAGKTDTAARLAANVSRSAPEWLGHAIEAGPVVFISAEEPERELRRRTWQHSQHDGYDPNTLTSLHLWFPDKSGDAVMAVADRYTGIMRPTRIMQEIAAAILHLAPVLVVVDNVAATFAGNQNDRVMVRSYVNLWRQIAHGPSKPAVLLLDHPSLSGLTNNTGRGGNMDWRNAVRCALWLHPPSEAAEADRGIRILETVKSNYGPPGDPLRLIWADGGLQLETAPTSLHRLAKDTEAEELFLRFLDERMAQGRTVSDKRGTNYAPAVFAEMAGNQGYTAKAFAKAMDRLFTARKIVLRSERRDGKIREVIDRANGGAG